MEKKLKPSLRENKRYLLITGGNREDIEKAILAFIGVLGYAKASPGFIEEGREFVILAINRESLDEIRAALTLAKKQIIVKRVSGTLKGLSKS